MVLLITNILKSSIFAIADIIGKILRYDLLVTLNAKKGHYAMQKVDAAMIANIFARMLNRKSTMKVAKKDGGHGFIEDLVYRMYLA